MMFLGSMFHLKFADLPLEVPQLVEEADSSADRHLHVQKQVKVDVEVEEEEQVGSQVDIRIQHLQLPNFLLEADSDSSSDLEHESYNPNGRRGPCSVYLHLPHLLLKVVQLFLKTSSNSDIDLQKEQFKDQSNSRLPAIPTLARAALSRGLAGGSPEFNSDYLRHWPSLHLLFNLPLPLCHTATHVFVNSNQMSNEVYFLRICKMYFLLHIVRIFSLQVPGTFLIINNSSH